MTKSIRLQNPDKGMHVEDIKAAIRKKDKTLTGLSEEWGYARTAISMALANPWPEMEARIAAFLGKKPIEIWPSRYYLDGTPKHGHRFRKKNNTIVRICNNQLMDAA